MLLVIMESKGVVLIEKARSISISYGLRPNKVARSYKAKHSLKTNAFKKDDQKHIVVTRK